MAKKEKNTEPIKPKKNKTVGRPEKYSKEIAEQIAEQIATTNKGLITICSENQRFPSYRTVQRWIEDDTHEFCRVYARAKMLQAEFMREEIVKISDHTDEDHTPFTGANVIQRDKLKIETRKWLMAKLHPKKYGDKIDITSDHEKIQPVMNLSNLSFDELLALRNGTKPGTDKKTN